MSATTIEDGIEDYKKQITLMKAKRKRLISAFKEDYEKGFPPESREAADEYLADLLRDTCSNPPRTDDDANHEAEWSDWVTSELLNQKDLDTWVAVAMIEDPENANTAVARLLNVMTQAAAPKPA